MTNYDNPNNLPYSVILRRISALDANASLRTYSVTGEDEQLHHIAEIDSILSSSVIIGLLAGVLTGNDTLAIARHENAKAEAALATELKSLTPAQAVAYVENNVTTLAQAKVVLKVMARLIVAMRDEVFQDLPEA